MTAGLSPSVRNGLRWALLLPAIALAWYAAIVATIFLHVHIERAWCPPEDLVSGFCDNETIRSTLAALLHITAALAAVAVIACAALVAPTHKANTVKVVLSLGLLAACYLSAGSWSMFAAAAAGGIVSTIASLRLIGNG